MNLGEYPDDLGPKESGGKTKEVFGVDAVHEEVDIGSKGDVTTGDGVRHLFLPGKGVLSTAFTTNSFRCLGRNGVNTHFLRRRSPAMFRARRVEPVKIEVIARGDAFGSLIKRHGDRFQPMQALDEPWIDLSYKDDADHDPLMIEGHNADGNEGFWLYPMGKPQSPDNKGDFVKVEDTGLHSMADAQLLRELAKTAYDIYREAWDKLGFHPPDLKMEFGYTLDGALILQDVVDFESGRLWLIMPGFPRGNPKMAFDKQFARDLKDHELTPENIAELFRRYTVVTEVSYLLAA